MFKENINAIKDQNTKFINKSQADEENWFGEKMNFVKDFLILNKKFYEILDRAEQGIVKIVELYEALFVLINKNNTKMLDKHKSGGYYKKLITLNIVLRERCINYSESVSRLVCIYFKKMLEFREKYIIESEKNVRFSALLDESHEILYDIAYFCGCPNWINKMRTPINTKLNKNNMEIEKLKTEVNSCSHTLEYLCKRISKHRNRSYQIFFEIYKYAEEIADDISAPLENPLNGSFQPNDFVHYFTDIKAICNMVQKIVFNQKTTFYDNVFQRYISITNCKFFTVVKDYLKKFHTFLKTDQFREQENSGLFNDKINTLTLENFTKSYEIENVDTKSKKENIKKYCQNLFKLVREYNISKHTTLDNHFLLFDELRKEKRADFILKSNLHMIINDIRNLELEMKRRVLAITLKAEIILKNAIKLFESDFAEKTEGECINNLKKELKNFQSIFHDESNPLRRHFEKNVYKNYFQHTPNPKRQHWDIFKFICKSVFQDVEVQINQLRIDMEFKSYMKTIKIGEFLETMLEKRYLNKIISIEKVANYAEENMHDLYNQLMTTFKNMFSNIKNTFNDGDCKRFKKNISMKDIENFRVNLVHYNHNILFVMQEIEYLWKLLPIYFYKNSDTFKQLETLLEFFNLCLTDFIRRKYSIVVKCKSDLQIIGKSLFEMENFLRICKMFVTTKLACFL
ncbi:hypothetical protein EDEG_00530 [Edhazardia aedis USNM 41457]|uniref:Uncharacterized protein n=1 Tax=Edhazardia aedis (strain USNM 41457) TaxID=1003232 RepID=J9DIR1_EDHAE|nr:hypothetical protein EDEG_00530 [Edhazardia aedis USNM 41457]|eukprot:EJW01257.1 hypothetical protein EDEG_00530 [Edhazardia aedis USNM 41457]